jgi:hypothetical protein
MELRYVDLHTLQEAQQGRKGLLVGLCTRSRKTPHVGTGCEIRR